MTKKSSNPIAIIAMMAVGNMIATANKGMAKGHHIEKLRPRAGGFSPTFSLA
jgi:hypothetical protein